MVQKFNYCRVDYNALKHAVSKSRKVYKNEKTPRWLSGNNGLRNSKIPVPSVDRVRVDQGRTGKIRPGVQIGPGVRFVLRPPSRRDLRVLLRKILKN